jgi:O-antigen/teichoic acid export membrane protein
MTDTHPRLGGVIRRLTLAQAATTAFAFITGPLLARALGPEGRGLLAAIVVPLTLAPWLVSFGLGTYAAKETARGRPIGEIVGTVGAVLCAIGAATALAGIPIANVLAGGRSIVATYLRIGFFLMPAILFSGLLVSVANGLQRWRALIVAQVAQPVIVLVGVIALFVSDRLTVESAAILTLASSVAPILPVAHILREARRPRFDPSVAWEGILFGVRAWVGGLGSIANARLDQLLMIRLVSERTLGLYVVATNTVGFSSILTGASASAIFPRVAAGDRALAPRSVRTILLVVGALGVVAAALAVPLLRLLYGSGFTDAAPMVWVLLAANLPLAGATMLGTVLTSSGRPNASAVSEMAALAITVPGLVVLLPLLGGIGAAAVSLIAYSVSFAILLVAASRYFQTPLRLFLLATRSDVRWLGDALRPVRER